MVHILFVTKVITASVMIMTLAVLSSGANGSLKAAAVPLTLSIAPGVIVGGNQATATVLLSSPATANVEVTLRSLNTAVAQFAGALGTAGTSHTIPPGSISATFQVRTSGVATQTAVRLQAITGGNTAETTLTVNPASVKTLTVSPTQVQGGNSATAAVTLDGLAPNAGVSIQMSLLREANSRTGSTIATDPSLVSLPSLITVAPGTSSTSFPISTTPVSSDVSITFRAAVASNGSVREASNRNSDGTSNTITSGGSLTPTATLTISAPAISRLQLTPSSVAGGLGSIGTVILTGKAPSGGLPIALSASSSDATMPTSISVPAGSDRTDFKITTQTTNSSRSVTIRAAIASSNADGSVRNPSDGTSNTITFGDGSVRSVSASTSAAAILSLTPTPPAIAIAVQPTQVVGGGAVAITLIVQPSSSSSTGPITLSSNHPELMVLPTSFPPNSSTQLSSGPQTISVSAGTNFAAADQNVTITATGASSSASTTLLVKQTPPLASFTLRPTTVTGGSNVIAQFLLVSNATGPVTVSLATDHPELIILPPTVSVPKSTVAAPFTFRTSTTNARTTVRITASAGNQTISTSVDVVP